MKKHLLLNRLSSLLYLLPTDKINLSSALLPNSYLAPSYSVNSPTANNKLLGKQWNIQLQKINALNQYMPVGHSLGMLHHHHQGNSSKQNLMHGFLAIHIWKIKYTFLLLHLSTSFLDKNSLLSFTEHKQKTVQKPACFWQQPLLVNQA